MLLRVTAGPHRFVYNQIHTIAASASNQFMCFVMEAMKKAEKKNVQCGIPNGISAEAKIMKPPPPPTWFSQSDPSKSP